MSLDCLLEAAKIVEQRESKGIVTFLNCSWLLCGVWIFRYKKKQKGVIVQFSGPLQCFLLP